MAMVTEVTMAMVMESLSMAMVMESLSMASLASAGSMADLESTRANSSRDGSDFFQSNHSVILHWLQLSGITDLAL